MLEETFTLFSGISEKKEKWLKKNGINSWEDLILSGNKILNDKEFKKIKKEIKAAKKHLLSRDIKYFTRKLDSKNSWILYENFKESACFLDIETTGLDEDSELTILGISNYERKYRVFVNGINFNPKKISKFLKKFKILITFYGSRFDVPYIIRRYPELSEVLNKMAHIDLCFLGHRVGFKGGLKKIEKQIGIFRNIDIDGLTGFDAVRLWNKYIEGDKDALITLIKYNRSDVVNLIDLINIEIKMMKDFQS
ncbi:MAG: ribonuclease H-like domain-containing protein [Thermoplasmata archaeon]